MAIQNIWELMEHHGHDIEVAYYSDAETIVNATIECDTCQSVLVSYDREGEDNA